MHPFDLFYNLIAFVATLVIVASVVAGWLAWVLALLARDREVSGAVYPFLTVGMVMAIMFSIPTVRGPSDLLAEQALAWQLAGMWHGAEGSAVGAPGASPYVKGAAAEDIARERAEAWTEAAYSVDVR